MSTLLSIPGNKTLLRRHLCLQINEVVGKHIVQEKRTAELASEFVPINPTIKVKVCYLMTSYSVSQYIVNVLRYHMIWFCLIVDHQEVSISATKKTSEYRFGWRSYLPCGPLRLSISCWFSRAGMNTTTHIHHVSSSQFQIRLFYTSH